MFLGATAHYMEEAVETAAEADCKVVTLSVTPPFYASKKLIGEGTEEEFLNAVAGMVTELAGKQKKRGLCSA